MGSLEFNPFQERVRPWMTACFGETIAGDKTERNHRFLEEALELVQACDCTESEAAQLVAYVYGRPTGQPQQEVGGVMVTLAALCLAQGFDMEKAGEDELVRIWDRIDRIRAKQAAKPKHSALPQAVDHRKEFEEDLFKAYFMKHVKRNPNPPRGTGAMDFVYVGVDDRAKVFERDGEHYKDEAIGAMWFGWQLAKGLEP